MVQLLQNFDLGLKSLPILDFASGDEFDGSHRPSVFVSCSDHLTVCAFANGLLFSLVNGVDVGIVFNNKVLLPNYQ